MIADQVSAALSIVATEDVLSAARKQVLVQRVRDLERDLDTLNTALGAACDELRAARSAAGTSAQTAVAAIERIQVMERLVDAVRNYFAWPTTTSIRAVRLELDQYEEHIKGRS